MKVKSSTKVKILVSRFPTCEETFDWHAIELDSDAMELTIEELGWEYDIDIDDFVADLQAQVDDARNDDDDDEDDEDPFEEGVDDDEDSDSASDDAPPAAGDEDFDDLDEDDLEDDDDL